MTSSVNNLWFMVEAPDLDFGHFLTLKIGQWREGYFEVWILYVNRRAFEKYCELTKDHPVAPWSVFSNLVKTGIFAFLQKKCSKAPPGDPWWFHYSYEKHVHWRTISMPRNNSCCHWPILMTKKWSIFNFSPVSIKSFSFKLSKFD